MMGWAASIMFSCFQISYENVSMFLLVKVTIIS